MWLITDAIRSATKKTKGIQSGEGIHNFVRLGILPAIALLSGIVVLTACSPPKSGAILPPAGLPTTTRIQIVTLEEAQQKAGFHLLEPTYLPDSVRLVSVTLMDDSAELEYRNQSPSEHREDLVLLRIRQTALKYPSGVPTLSATPDLGRETTVVRGTHALVNRNFILPTDSVPEAIGQSYNSIEWIENGIGVIIMGSPSVDELKKIAESLQ